MPLERDPMLLIPSLVKQLLTSKGSCELVFSNNLNVINIESRMAHNEQWKGKDNINNSKQSHEILNSHEEKKTEGDLHVLL